MTALSYNECEIDRGKLSSARQSFEDLHAKISGRSDEYHTITEPVGFQFSDLIGESLRSAATENKSSWSSAMMACTHAFGVLNMISDAVKTYEDKIADIKARLDEKLASLDEPDNMTAVNNAVEPFNQEAKEAWRKLENECDTAQDTLREGPTAGNIRMLAEAGHLGDTGLIGFYTTEDLDYFAVDPDQAELIASHIEHAVLDGREGSIDALENDPEYLALVANVVDRALRARNNGEKLSNNEIKFLETLFSELSETRMPEDGFLTFIDHVNESEHIGDQLRDDINRRLANGVLVLSDESLGGGMDRLPPDVVDAANGQEPPESGSVPKSSGGSLDDAWQKEYAKLGSFLASSGPGVQGGTEFSATLLATSANHLKSFPEPYVDQDDAAHQDIIEVASRNEEANHILITGKDFDGDTYEYNANNQGLTPEDALGALYSHDWDDDGEALSGITDWLARSDAGADGVSDANRDSGLIGLVQLFEDKDFKANVFETSHSVTDDDGIEWLNASGGHVNTKVAESFGDIFLENMDIFADPDGLDDKSQSTEWNERQQEVELSADGRLSFTQFMAGDPDTAANVYREVLLNGAETMEEYATNTGDREHKPTMEAGTLQGLVERAVTLEAETRETNHEEEVDFQSKVIDNTVSILGGGGGDLNVSGVVVETAKFMAKEGLTPDKHDADPNVTTREEWDSSERMKTLSVATAASGDPDLMQELKNRGIAKENDSGELYVPLDHTEWEGVENADESKGEWNGDNKVGELAEQYTGVADSEWPDGESKTSDAVFEFVKNFETQRAKWSEVG